MTLFGDLVARLEGTIEIPEDKPEEDARSTVAALWWSAAGAPRSAALAFRGALPDLDHSALEHLHDLVEQRLSGTPLSYLTRRQHFLGLEMYAAPGALIPRRETEILGRAALGLIKDTVARRGIATVIDVCTGSGNLALAYAAHEPRAQILAADLSADAIEVARENARQMGMPDRVDFRSGDLLAPFGDDWNGRVDIVSCNPPYISTAKVGTMHAEIAGHEPSLAFDGGPFGIRILSRFIKEAVRLVRPGGWICFEVGLGQGPAMASRLNALGVYDDVRQFQDEGAAVRALAARLKEQA
ncbi:MAG: HemK/PrmC family methyltransferase [Vicinamibacterales bacterium]|nr:HemK/PrmC family methyltransferase [Vicinamibacterales bacterium]